MAPNDLHRRTIELIDEQAQRAREGRPSRIFAKLNAIVDHRVIESLYRASQAGVPIDIVARGHVRASARRSGAERDDPPCGVSWIGFWKHSRIYVFGPDEDAKVFLSSADWMPRNFFRRVEVMFPGAVARTGHADPPRDPAGVSRRQRAGAAA